MDAELLLTRIKRTLNERIARAQYTPVSQLQIETWRVPDETVDGQTVIGEPANPSSSAHFTPLHVGQTWGKPWQTVWFNIHGTTPNNIPAGDTVEARINLGWADHSAGFQSEGLVRDSHGHTVKALNPRNQWIPLPQTPHTSFDFSIEAAANPLLLEVLPFQVTYDGDKLTSSEHDSYRLTQADVVIRHTDVVNLTTDITVLSELLEAKGVAAFTNDDYETLYALNSALDRLDLHNIPGTAAAARAEIAPILARPALPGAHRLSAVGHAHIDSAWLWPIRETKRKVNRTIANVVRLIEDGTGLVFALPAAQHVAWLAEEDPELFERVKKCVHDGSIVPVGSMWVEPDAVLPGGEAMARQLVEGISFFREAFNYECQEIWLPDSFGYSGALPQLAREAGITRFLTQKISWNQTNVFPHHTLQWEGIDGSRIFTHFPPADTYGSEITGEQIRHAVENFKNKGEANCSLLPYGYGDGGGGPTREMMERLDRLEDFRGAPRVVRESPHDFFERAEAEFPQPPVWVGELYLELHRGTFTSQIAAKQGNRRSEALLRETELWCTVAALAGASYPHDELRALWRNVLLCQFHDILPGTSVAWVYREVADIYASVKETCERLIANAFTYLSEGRPTAHALANATSFSSRGVTPLGAAVPTKTTGGVGDRAHAGELCINNGVLTIDFANDGACTQITDATGHTFLPAGEKAGQFSVFQDFPNMWDAWDIDPFYQGSEQVLPLEFDGTRIDDDGVACARAHTSFSNSDMSIEWRLAPRADYIDVHVEANWHEHEKLLKLGFPVNIHTSKAQYETQMGYIERPTHTNTSWDSAKFEVSTHRWIRLGNEQTSWSIANDATYGWDITRHSAGRRGTWSLVRATLVKSAVYPDPNQDQGRFSWNFRIRPQASVAQAIADGQQLNLPLREVPVDITPPFSVSGAIVESVAMAPDKSGDVVVRLYEGLGGPAHVTLTWPDVQVMATDLCYRPSGDAPTVSSHAGKHSFDLAPFQIATLRITPAERN
ncbi:alpha-mannosidase [Arcanobacterium buesumense]|uniref:Alpha-mannosidase n=1 Tax=Arcanobacterium buesumense TaxID=2722751 RepID=A0A6H2EIE2_9ACTO|nr:alpha-mannosidase [Arcanobacterium buesumense]QJC21086.1 alpha-mannosidase [Arcanobacterium buesumense]